LEEAIVYFELYETMHRHPHYLDEVVERASTGLAAGNSDVNAHLALARSYIEQNRTGDATRELGQAVEQFPDNALVWYWLGTVRARSGDVSGALAALDRAIVIQPLFVDALSKRAEVNMGANRIEQAIRDYESVLGLDPVHHPKDWNNLGFVRLQSGDVDEAVPILSRAAKLEPLLLEARINLGSALLVAGRLEEAVSEFETVLGLDSESVPAMGNLGIAYERLGRSADARSMLQRLLVASPGDQNAARLLKELDTDTRP
jgi:tetratricopeptide (TPR) repeat protein